MTLEVYRCSFSVKLKLFEDDKCLMCFFFFFFSPILVAIYLFMTSAIEQVGAEKC